MFWHKLLQKSICCLVCVFSFCAASYAQDEPRQGEAQRTRAEDGAVVPGRPSNIVSDNLDKAAATADQILEVLNKEIGLMVEFKRLLARDAGTSGQIVEETDLTDVAIAERLRSDLRARVLATRLVQRYGFLTPRLNPESDKGTEQKLVQQERAQMLARAAERRDMQVESATDSRNAVYEPRIVPPSPTAPEEPTPSSPLQSPRANDTPPVKLTRDDDTGLLPDTMLNTSQAETPELNRMQSAAEYETAETSSLRTPRRDTQSLPATQSDELNPLTGGTGTPRASKDSGRRPTIRESAAANAPEADPSGMLHRPTPYSDVPSLYDLYVQAGPLNRPLTRFGLDVFRKGSATAAYIPMDLPVGPGYVVGPGDSLSIDLWGGVSQRLLRTVDREGRVTLPEAGPVLVSGQTLGDVQQMVQRTLRTQFRDVSADVALLRLRSVRMYVVGDVTSPGAYDVSALSTPLNALFAAGGVTSRGSLRRLQHYRGKQLIEEVDGYDLLLRGIRGELQRIENGDSLMVPPLGPVVTVEGMVRRPAIYELRNEKTLLDVLNLAGGILPAAALRHIEVQRLVAHEKRIMLSVSIPDASDSEAVRQQMRDFAVQDGDEIHIFPIAPYNSASIYLIGHVLRPGRYAYLPEMKLSDLVTSYADLLPEPSTRYAEIIRLHAPDYHPVVETFDLAAALEHPAEAPKLEPLDTVHIFGRYDFEPDPEVLITGEVRKPGLYRTSGQQHLRDAVYQAGGVTPDAWLDSAQLFRRQLDGSARVFSINLGSALAGDPLNNLAVQPRDRILIHRQPEQLSASNVYIRGDVARPGRYPFAASMTVSDLVRSAGGLLRSANPYGGDLTSYAISNSSGERLVAGHQDLNLAAALAGKEDQNLTLRDGDVLTVPQQSGWNDVGATVAVRGEIGKPGVYGIKPGERLSSLLQRAGGLLPTASARAALFERVEVRELQQQSRQELIQRLEQESTVVKTSATTSGTEEAALQQAAVQQRERVLEALRRAPVSGRLVIHLRPDRKDFAGSPEDIELRAGDSLTIPKQPGAVLVIGQVYNANALTYKPGKDAGWYLSRAGGVTQLANKGGIFIIRADGSVTSKADGPWSGGVLAAGMGPGDMVVVPEKAVLGSSTLKNVLAVAQIASSAALVAAVAIP
jgi:polysaccharide biosynthesis/export protein